MSTYAYLHLNPGQTQPDLKDLVWCNRWRCNPIRPWEMVEGWEERREAADSVFLFPVVCWLSVMRPRLRPRRPVIGQGIRWLPREAWPGPGRRVRPKPGRQTSFQKQCRHKERKGSCTNLLCCVDAVWMVNYLNGSWNMILSFQLKKGGKIWKHPGTSRFLIQLNLFSPLH